MRAVFADAGYWIALWRPRDALHDRAEAETERLGGTTIVTTQLVLVEVLGGLGRMGEFRRGFVAERVRELDSAPDLEIVEQTGVQFRAALERYAARLDQRWSLTDCASFLVMEERGITEALAFDRDFEQAGFTALLRERHV